jgi:hypothetical protein
MFFIDALYARLTRSSTKIVREMHQCDGCTKSLTSVQSAHTVGAVKQIPLQEQLYKEFERSGMSVGVLLRMSGLELDRSSLSRKLRGHQPISTVELEVLCAALRMEVRYSGRAA